MKQFNQVIMIAVSVDSIATKLRSQFTTDNSHGDLITETIIETALHDDRLAMVYSAINGYSTDINFKVKQPVVCDAKYWGYEFIKATANDSESSSKPTVQKQLVIGNAEIKEIDKFRKDIKTILLTFIGIDGKGEDKEYTEWVLPQSLTLPE